MDAPLQAGHGWEWSPTWSTSGEPVFNSESDSWDYGRWNQVAGRGIGYAPSPGGATAPPHGGSNGAVPSIPGGGMKIPGAQLPADITALFNKQPGQTPVQGAYQQALLDVLGRSQQTPSLSDPTLAPQVEVFRAQQQRNQERQRRAAAERAAATGMNQSGYLDNLIEQGEHERGFNTATFNANLLGGEMTKRREELQGALHLARLTGDAEAERELRARLAQVSAMMQQQGLNLQGQLGEGDLALRLLQTVLGDNQFYDSLGINSALNLEGLNQRALQLGLGG